MVDMLNFIFQSEPEHAVIHNYSPTESSIIALIDGQVSVVKGCCDRVVATTNLGAKSNGRYEISWDCFISPGAWRVEEHYRNVRPMYVCTYI